MYSASLFAEETEEEKAEREGKARKKAAAKAEKLRAQGKTAEAEQVLKKCEAELAKEAGQLHAEAEKEKQKKDDDALMTLTVVFSLVVSIALFMMLPYCYIQMDADRHSLRDPDRDCGGHRAACDFLWLSGARIPDEGYSAHIYVSWRRAQMHQLH